MFDAAREKLRAARSVVAFTGAGVAAESGIPTFRGGGGLWDEYPPSIYGTPLGLTFAALLRPSRFRSFVRAVTGAFFEGEPNAGHLALGALASSGRLGAVITQNIDDLHERGGAEPVYKLHGDLLTGRCLGCGRRQPIDPGELHRRLDAATASRWLAPWKLLEVYPRCVDCGGRQRPDVVLFGEGLPQDAWSAAREALEHCDLLVISGTSGLVSPANKLPDIAVRRDVPVIEISPEPTVYSEWVDYPLCGSFAEVMPRLAAL